MRSNQRSQGPIPNCRRLQNPTVRPSQNGFGGVERGSPTHPIEIEDRFSASKFGDLNHFAAHPWKRPSWKVLMPGTTFFLQAEDGIRDRPGLGTPKSASRPIQARTT